MRNISQEVSSLTEILQMIGGTNDYMAAVLIAAFINLYQDEVNVDIAIELESVHVHVYNRKYPPKMLIDAVLPIKYMELFA